ncbi:MAG: hypothetical protein WAX80_00465 [Minisyncoccia bacterium]
MDFRGYLAFDSGTTLDFFHKHLERECAGENVAKTETAHVASVLATYAQVPVDASTFLQPFAIYSDAFEDFSYPQEYLRSPLFLAEAGAHKLFIIGCFRNQVRHLIDIQRHGRLGQVFYRRASMYSPRDGEKELFERVSRNFDLWTSICDRALKGMREGRDLPRH